MHLIFNNKSLEIPTDQPLVLGRNIILEITDQRISRRQVSVYYNSTKGEYQVSLLAPNENVFLNGSLLKFQEPVSIHDQDILCLYNDSYCITFTLDSECTTPEEIPDQILDLVSDESSDIYDFEVSHKMH